MPKLKTNTPYSGLAIVIARTQRRVKAISLARAIGIHRSRLSMMENDWITIPEDVARAIAHELGVPLESLIKKENVA